MNLICYYRGHDFKHVANFRAYTVQDSRIGLWQCNRCKILHMDMPSEFYDKRKRKQPYGK